VQNPLYRGTIYRGFGRGRERETQEVCGQAFCNFVHKKNSEWCSNLAFCKREAVPNFVPTTKPYWLLPRIT
jgi:hypothetical protein